jgi:hypothetical protein
MNVITERELAMSFRECAGIHRLRLHRIHMLSATKAGSFPSTVVLDCRCGRRWLLKVPQADVVAVDGSVLAELGRGRERQTTAPPGFAAAPHDDAT